MADPIRIYSAFTVPPEHSEVAIVTPLVSGGSLLSLMAWRKSLPADEVPNGLFRSMSGRGRPTQDLSLSRGRLTEEEIKATLKQVVCGLGYLHGQGIIHVRAFKHLNQSSGS
jgi:serine/threonine-protein kinase OSR1/STK39